MDVLIFNLHESWGNIAGSLTTAAGNLKINDVKGALIDEEGRRDGPNSPETTALHGKLCNHQTRSKSVTCYWCNKPGHIARNCKEEIQEKRVEKAALAAEFSF